MIITVATANLSIQTETPVVFNVHYSSVYTIHVQSRIVNSNLNIERARGPPVGGRLAHNASASRRVLMVG